MISFTIPLRFSTFISARQQMLPFFSQVMRASLSPVLIPAFSRTSLGSTICPRSSTLRTASTWHPDPGVHPSASSDGSHPALKFFLVIHVPDYYGDSQYLYFSEKSEKSN